MNQKQRQAAQKRAHAAAAATQRANEAAALLDPSKTPRLQEHRLTLGNAQDFSEDVEESLPAPPSGQHDTNSETSAPATPFVAATQGQSSSSSAVFVPTASSSLTPSQGLVPATLQPASPQANAPQAIAPTVVQQVPPVKFHGEKSLLFMDDSHASLLQPARITSRDVDEFFNRLERLEREYPNFPVLTRTYFSASAQELIEAYVLTRCADLIPVDQSVWAQPWRTLVAVLRRHYPAAVIGPSLIQSQALTAARSHLQKIFFKEDAPHRLTSSRNPESGYYLLRLTLLEVLQGSGLSRDSANEFLQSEGGSEIVFTFRKCLEKSNISTDQDFRKQIDAFESDMRAQAPDGQYRLSFSGLQGLIGKRIQELHELQQTAIAAGVVNPAAIRAGGQQGQLARPSLPTASAQAHPLQVWKESIDLTGPSQGTDAMDAEVHAINSGQNSSRDLQRWGVKRDWDQRSASPAQPQIHRRESGQWAQRPSSPFTGRDRGQVGSRPASPQVGRSQSHYGPRPASPYSGQRQGTQGGQFRDHGRTSPGPSTSGRDYQPARQAHRQSFPQNYSGRGQGQPQQGGRGGRGLVKIDACIHCGKRHSGGSQGCDFLRYSHPDVNRENRPFLESTNGRRYQLISENNRSLIYNQRLWPLEQGPNTYWILVPTDEGPSKPTRAVRDEFSVYDLPNEQIDESVSVDSIYSEYARLQELKAQMMATKASNVVNTADPKGSDRDYFKVFARVGDDQVDILLDSGCIGRDFISTQCCEKYNFHKYKLKYPITVKSIHGQEIATEVVNFNDFRIHCGEQYVTIPSIHLIVLREAPTDVIVGHETLREHAVYGRLTRHFGEISSTPEVTAVKEGCTPNEPAGRSPRAGCLSLRTRMAMGEEATGRLHVSQLLPQSGDDDPTEGLLPEDELGKILEKPDGEAEFRDILFGDEKNRQLLSSTIGRNKITFSTTISTEPAKVTPFSFKVDYDAFKKDRRSHEPTRMQIAARKIVVSNFIRQAIADNMIRPSAAEAWSQILLVPKPNGGWRFTIDYRALNKYTEAARALIPNIKKLIATIGAAKPKYFAKMDLTSGFFQMPLAEDCMKYTAFAVEEGLFEFTRASMGLLNTPWYFQGIMDREVFADMVNRILVVYIDDILTWSDTIEGLCENMEKIFHRLNEKGMKLNPAKCSFGMTEVEFVGHLIDGTGITFTKERLESVEKFPVPKTKGDLKSFLGVANFFRDHVVDYEMFAESLQAMTPRYQKSHSEHRLEWTDEQAQNFEAFRQAVVNCRKLFYVDNDFPVRVYTDASNYGIGAYLCQVDEDGKEIPIEFISKTLTKSEKKWSTFEKEAFAIFYALRKWETYLRDRRFTLFTDHKNLTYISKDPNAKVTRWRLAVQDYDFDIAYIPGEDNFIADAMSRLCPTEILADDELIDKAGASIAALFSSNFDEWDPIRFSPIEREHEQYFVESTTSFQNLHHCVTCASIQASRGGEKKSYKFEGQYIPQLQYDIIQKCHNYSVGHFGVDRTIELVKELIARDPQYENLEWLKMRADVRSFINRCDCCIKMNERKLLNHTKKYVTSEYGVMKCISVDAIHMQNETPRKNKYVLTVVDAFTRYVSLYAVPDMTAQTAAKVLMNHFCIYGIPEKITTDNSTEYMKEFEEMLDILVVENYKIHAYSHQENGIVERANKEIVRHLRNMAYECRTRNDWDEQLLKVQAILNEKVSEATGLRPNEILFVGQVSLNDGRLFPHPTESQLRRMSKYMKEQLELQDAIMRFSEDNQELRDSMHLQDDDNTEIPFSIGEYLVVKHESGRAENKLQSRHHGPYRIIQIHKRPQGTVYTCYSPKNGKTYDFHNSFVSFHPCRDDKEAVLSAVLDDTDSYVIENISSHKIEKQKKSKRLKLFIKWHGEKEPKWHYLDKSLKANAIVQEYLEQHSLTKEFGVTLAPRGTTVVRKSVTFRDDTKPK